MNGLGVAYSLKRYEDSPYCGIEALDPDGGALTRNYSDLLTTLEKWAEMFTGPRCRECNGPQVFGWAKDCEVKMRERGTCFICMCWADNYEDAGPHVAIVDGHRYSIAPDVPKGERGFVGHGGAEFRIRFDDGREVVTHNLWAQGRIPPCWRDRMPDNATFVAREHGAYHGAGSAGCAAA